MATFSSDQIIPYTFDTSKKSVYIWNWYNPLSCVPVIHPCTSHHRYHTPLRLDTWHGFIVFGCNHHIMHSLVVCPATWNPPPTVQLVLFQVTPSISQLLCKILLLHRGTGNRSDLPTPTLSLSVKHKNFDVWNTHCWPQHFFNYCLILLTS